MAFWARRSVGRFRAERVDESGGGKGRASKGGGSGAGRAGGPPPVIDLRDEPGWASRVAVDPDRAAELAERFRARTARREALRELSRLRDRHWSGERVIEEGRTTIEWWEHPDADPFAVLGILPGATLEEANRARRDIAQRCHPDRTTIAGEDVDEGLRRMVAANAAYERIRRALRRV